MYDGLSALAVSALPDAVLDPLLVRLRLEETATGVQLSARQWLMQADAALRSVVGKEALQAAVVVQATSTSQNVHQATGKSASSSRGATNAGADESTSTAGGGGHQLHQHQQHQRGKRHLRQMMANTCDAVEKLQQLERVWPEMLLELIRRTLLDYAQLDVYVQRMMAEVLRCERGG